MFRDASLPLPAGGSAGHQLVDWRSDTLVDALRRRAAADPDLIVYTYLEDGETRERSLTVSALDTQARSIGRTLARLARPGERAILLFDDGLDYIAGLFGCLSAGLIAVSGIHPAAPRSVERLEGIIRDSRATVVLGHASILAEFQRALDEQLDDFDLRWVPVEKIRAVAGDRWTGTPAANGDLALIQYTSGSTREPRGVTLSHRNILHNLHGQATSFGYRLAETGVSWLPFSHDMGLIGCVLMAVYGGGRCILLSPSHFLEDPMRWLRAISRYRATLSGGPNFAFDLCARKAETTSLAGLNLSSWTVAVSGAEPIRADVLRRFAARFAEAGFDSRALHPSYGLAEATLLVTNGQRFAPMTTRRFEKAALQCNAVVEVGPDAEGGAELVGCGRGLPDQDVAIVDPQTHRRVAAGLMGEIWVAGPSISAGYFERIADNSETFGGDLADGGGPYLRTGDLGFMLDGELFIAGRLRDLLVIRGKNYYPQDIEFSAEGSHGAVRPACSVAFVDEETGGLVVVAELLHTRHGEAAAVVSAIREAIVCDHGIAPLRVVLGAWGAVLKTPSGKVQRAQTRAAEAAGTLSIVHRSVMPQASAEAMPITPVDMARVEDWVLSKLRAMGVELPALDPAMRLTELGFDSLKIVELKVGLERDLGIVVNIADLYAFEDIRSLAEHLRAEARRGADGPLASLPDPPSPRPANRLAEQRQRRRAADAAAGGHTSI